MAEAIAAASPVPSPQDRAQTLRPLLIGCVLAGTLMQALDGTVANVALPHMQGSLQASRDQITWVLTSYVIAAAIMTAPVGWLAGRFGRRNLYVFSLVSFTLTSVACGAATSLEQMVLFRTLQGVFGAALSPLSQSMILDLFPKEQRARGLSIFGSIIMVGPILGPTVGGYLTDALSWRWVFYINVPVGIAATIGILLFPARGLRDRDSRFDWMAFGFLSLGLGALQLMLDRGSGKGWFDSSEIWIEAVLGGLGFYLFIVHLLTSDTGFLPRTLLKDQNYIAGFLMMFLVGVLMMASTTALPPYLENVGGYSIVYTGLIMSPRGLGTILSMNFCTRNATRLDPRLLVGCGVVLTSWTMWDMAHWSPAISVTHLISTLVIQGISTGLLFAPVNLLSFATLAPEDRTSGAAFINLGRSVGGAIGISVSSAIITASAQATHAQLAAHVTPFNRALDWGAQSMYWSRSLPFGLQQLDAVVNQQAQIIANSNSFYILSVVSFLTLFALVLIRHTPSSGDAMEIAKEMVVE